MRRLRLRAASRPGYTLVELLLALAVLAMLAGVVMPSVLRMHADSRLSEVTEVVRYQLGSTRSRAIEGGLVYQFRFEPDGRNFIAIPFEREFEGSDLTSSGSGATTGLGVFTRYAGELPTGFRFNDCSDSAGSDSTQPSQQLSEEALGELPNAQELSGLSWSQAILFVPDGSAIDYAFEVADGRDQAIRLEVRGLTGATTQSRIISATESSR
ncbi:MAG TPA: prepilin-type N-terminal cleavage/methylation domain-containing protein [Planctomycetaceae bacterium]|nr:prepilin-type N-terminal cleavage/methylation domain-containing protein [Planctomycetaceae bacterium]